MPSVGGPPRPMPHSSSSVPSSRGGPAPGLSNDSTLISSFDSAGIGSREQTLDASSLVDQALSPMGPIPSVISSLSHNGEPTGPHQFRDELSIIDNGHPHEQLGEENLDLNGFAQQKGQGW